MAYGSKRKSFSFWKREDGGVTIEAVLWVPMFVIILAMIADVSLVFFRQSTILRTVQDANRAYSIGRITSEEATAKYVTDSLATLSSTATATTTQSLGIVQTTASVPVSDLTAVGVFNFLSGYNIGVSARHYIEY
ncbi:pilus assembly protein [Aliiroseovarius sp. KMU-50]|uniref:Pilus assembly protein n=1 Tax=Aliiroseovarius salicola TaxID=3009082 RepID=A0ABT4W5G2_9RHOB|nr:TadE family protein [Aliiroseovarius sp. KMU-50]MDA5094983.1 pilus assembly protein [Aliiroseovarius sp. KMU-50]